MPVLRLIVAAGVAFVAICATLFAAALVLFTGLVGFVLQLFRRQPIVSPAAGARPARKARSDDAIDVVATKVGE